MKLFQLLSPERAHALALQAVKNGLVFRGAPDAPNPRVTLFGKEFLNPVGLAAGADKKAEALAGWAKMGFGFVEAGTVTRHPRKGNPRPRLWRVGDSGLVNWLGLPGDGLSPFLRNLKRFQQAPERENLVLGASLASPDGSLDELRQLSSACAPFVDYLTLNVSCPNVANHAETEALQQAATQVKAVAGAADGRPLLVKLGPTRDGDALGAILKTVMDAGASGIVATNTVSWDNRALLKTQPVWPQHGGKPVGGYSGPDLLDISCWMVEQARSLLGANVPIIGCGGIQRQDDAMRMFKAGADIIQLYTGLVYKGPRLLGEIKQAYCVRRRADQEPRLSGDR